MSKFFVEPEPLTYDKVLTPTIVMVPDVDSEGRSFMNNICIETFLRPCSLLNFDDFSISTLLKNGISPKSLAISNDMRVGFDDSVFDELDSRLSAIADSLFVSSSN